MRVVAARTRWIAMSAGQEALDPKPETWWGLAAGLIHRSCVSQSWGGGRPVGGRKGFHPCNPIQARNLKPYTPIITITITL